jgi:MtN3 and saliva related transmembrane protein
VVVFETAFGVAAASWGVVMALAPVLQIVRMHRRRSSDDVSIGYLAVLLPGFLLWVSYGVTTANVALVVPNTVAAVVAAATIVVVLRLRHDPIAVSTRQVAPIATHCPDRRVDPAHPQAVAPADMRDIV